jgi:hypothetical protein
MELTNKPSKSGEEEEIHMQTSQQKVTLAQQLLAQTKEKYEQAKAFADTRDEDGAMAFIGPMATDFYDLQDLWRSCKSGSETKRTIQNIMHEQGQIWNQASGIGKAIRERNWAAKDALFKLWISGKLDIPNFPFTR